MDPFCLIVRDPAPLGTSAGARAEVAWIAVGRWRTQGAQFPSILRRGHKVLDIGYQILDIRYYRLDIKQKF